MEIVWFDELPPYPVRSFTYRNEQVRAYTESRVIVYNKFKEYMLLVSAKSAYDPRQHFDDCRCGGLQRKQTSGEEL
jgi:hypothetical protein